MSSFTIRATHKTTGVMSTVWCLDNHFGHNEYGYIVNSCHEDVGDKAMTEKEFYKNYQPEEPQT